MKFNSGIEFSPMNKDDGGDEHSGMENITQIVPETGMSEDYMNDFVGFSPVIQMGGIQGFINAVKKYKWVPKTYEEFFAPKTTKNPVTEQNKSRVESLNLEVEKFKKIIDENIENLTLEDFNNYARSIQAIIKPKNEWTDL
ncbi:MAG: hypothetical protein WCG55_03740 [bacterium]